MMEGRRYYAANTMSLFLAYLIDRVLVFAERCYMKRINLFYTEAINEVLLGHNEAASTERELTGLRSQISNLKIFVERTLLHTAHLIYPH